EHRNLYTPGPILPIVIMVQSSCTIREQEEFSMRSSLMMLALFAVPQIAGAQTFPAEMTVTVSEVEVRSGPTKEYYPTGKLRYGDRVLVIRESKDQPGWLAIRPPHGSF